MLSEKLKIIGNENVRLFRDPATGVEEMYVLEDLVPQQVLSMCIRVIGNCDEYIYCQTANWNYFFRDTRDELRGYLNTV